MPMNVDTAIGLRKWLIGTATPTWNQTTLLSIKTMQRSTSWQSMRKIISKAYKSHRSFRRSYWKHSSIFSLLLIIKSYSNMIEGGAYLNPKVQIDFFPGLGYGLKATEVMSGFLVEDIVVLDSIIFSNEIVTDGFFSLTRSLFLYLHLPLHLHYILNYYSRFQTYGHHDLIYLIMQPPVKGFHAVMSVLNVLIAN